MEQQLERPKSTPTYAHEPPAAAVEKPSPPPATSDFDGTLIDVLVTPKLTFKLPRKTSWQVVEDVPQSELQKAFLARFPVRFEAADLAFTCATPALPLKGQQRLVYRISSVDGGEDERVLLRILQSLDKAYTAKFEQQLEAARADLLSSSCSFQVVADEVRAGQAAAAKKWEKEIKGMKEQMSTNQKRLFLLEREKEGLMKTCAASDELTTKLRASVSGLSVENAALKERQADLESQLHALREMVQSIAGAGASSSQSPRTSSVSADDQGDRSEAATQTAVLASEETSAEEAAQRLASEKWQQQLQAMRAWLLTGADLLTDAPGGVVPQAPYGAAPVGFQEEAEASAAGMEPSSVC